VLFINSAHAQPPDKADVLAKLNDARRLNGVPPLAWNAQLEKAAQRHSDDMSSKGFVDEIGSDGSSSRQRVTASGYARWPGVQVWGESIYAGQTTFDEALNFFLSDDAQRRALLNPRLREVGIGIAKDNLRSYWTVTVGSQPNLLPIFINDGAAVTNDRQVAVLLTQEEAVPQGDTNAIGRVLEVRISDTPNFSNTVWQPWESLVPFTLSRSAGNKTVYVQMRDGAGRTTIATDDIQYDPNSRALPRPVGPGAVITPTATLVIEPSPTTLPTPTTQPPTTSPFAAASGATPTAIVIGAPVVVDATATPATPATPATLVTPTALSAATPTSAAVVVIVVPTFTPPPPPPPASESAQTTIVLTPVPDAPTSAFTAPEAGLPSWIVPVYLVVQALVIVIGFALFLRRKQL
jgi:hypothetical protein